MTLTTLFFNSIYYSLFNHLYISHNRHFLTTIACLFSFLPVIGQLNPELQSKLEEVDDKIDVWQYKEAKTLLKELELANKNLSNADRFALELRIFKTEYYIDNNENNFGLALKYLEQIKQMNVPKLEYDYLSFIGEIYKDSFNFENALLFHNRALANAENRKDTTDIIFSCWRLGSCYYTVEYVDRPKLYKNKLDSAVYYYSKTLKFPENNKSDKYLPRIYNNLARIETFRDSLNIAESYINRALRLHKKNNDSFGIAISLNNLSKVYLKKKDYLKSIDLAKESDNFIKDRSLRIKRNNLKNTAYSYYGMQFFKEAFEAMEKTLVTSEELTVETFGNNVKKIELKYKQTKEQQRTLIEKNRRLKFQILLYTSFFFIILLIIFGTSIYMRQKKYKNRFNALILETEMNNEKKERQKKKSEIPSEIVRDVLKKLDDFERNEKFTNIQLSLNSLAKQLGTNSNYLSKVINTQKNVSFSNYLINLRLNFAIQKLKNDAKFRKYTIKAIANEVGYKTQESFSRAFYKKTGIYPSYFIKQLNKNFEAVD